MPKISKIIYRQLPKISKKHAMYMPKISKQEIRLYGSRHPLSFLYKREKTLFEMIVSVFVSLSCRFRLVVVSLSCRYRIIIVSLSYHYRY